MHLGDFVLDKGKVGGDPIFDRGMHALGDSILGRGKLEVTLSLRGEYMHLLKSFYA